MVLCPHLHDRSTEHVLYDSCFLRDAEGARHNVGEMVVVVRIQFGTSSFSAIAKWCHAAGIRDVAALRAMDLASVRFEEAPGIDGSLVGADCRFVDHDCSI